MYPHQSKGGSPAEFSLIPTLPVANQELGYMPGTWNTCVMWLSINDQPHARKCSAFLIWLMLSENYYTEGELIKVDARQHLLMLGKCMDLCSVLCLIHNSSTSPRLSELGINHPHKSNMRRACTMTRMWLKSLESTPAFNLSCTSIALGTCSSLISIMCHLEVLPMTADSPLALVAITGPGNANRNHSLRFFSNIDQEEKDSSLLGNGNIKIWTRGYQHRKNLSAGGKNELTESKTSPRQIKGERMEKASSGPSCLYKLMICV